MFRNRSAHHLGTYRVSRVAPSASVIPTAPPNVGSCGLEFVCFVSPDIGGEQQILTTAWGRRKHPIIVRRMSQLESGGGFEAPVAPQGGSLGRRCIRRIVALGASERILSGSNYGGGGKNKQRRPAFSVLYTQSWTRASLASLPSALLFHAFHGVPQKFGPPSRHHLFFRGKRHPHPSAPPRPEEVACARPAQVDGMKSSVPRGELKRMTIGCRWWRNLFDFAGGSPCWQEDGPR